MYISRMKEKSKGGSRSGAGRKPSVDPKQPVTIFVETSIVESFGGKGGVQLFLYSALQGSNLTAFSSPKDVFDGKKNKILEIEGKIPQKKGLANLIPNAKKKTNRVDIVDSTKPTSDLKPQEQPKTNFSIDTRPKTLDDLKSRCPADLEGLDRSKWIATERQKYGI